MTNARDPMTYRMFIRYLSWTLLGVGAAVSLRARDLGGAPLVVAVTFLIVGALLVFYDLLIRRELRYLTNDLSARLHSIESAKEYARIGLVDAVADCIDYDYGPLISDSRRLVIVLNDGRTWASVHRDRLRRRFADPQKQTTIFVCHPDSPMLSVLARKGSIDVKTLQARIHETVHLLEELHQHDNPEILGHFLFNPYSLVMGETSAVITPYFLSRGGRTVPAFRFEDIGTRCFFRDIADDVERLRMDAQSLGGRSRRAALEVVPLPLPDKG